uniref:Major sperm protein n=1 Tax=Panagrolaimus sp. JU765 TaxID=591449 RepID=A0AC34REN0_9BILA
MSKIHPLKQLSLLTMDQRNLLTNVLIEVNKCAIQGKIYPSDLDFLNENKWWALAFIKAHKEDVHITSAVIQECLRWRKSFDIHGMKLVEFVNSEEKLNVYIRGKDVYGNRLLWIKLNKHNPNDRTIDRLLVYWLETNLIWYHSSPLTVVIDLSEVRTLDITLLKFMLHCFKYFYPNCLSEILIYKTPSRLSATVKLFQSWLSTYDLPMAHELVDPHQILAFIREENLPYEMDGTDDFTMDDLAKSAPAKLAPNVEQTPLNNENLDIAVHPSIDEIITNKRSVRFEETTDMVQNQNARNNSSTRKNVIPSILKPIYEDRKNANTEEWFDGGFVSVIPKDALLFKQINDEVDPVDIFIIKNTGGYGLQYKIKTTSPEKFRVRPSVGFIPAGESDFVRIYLQHEYKDTLKSERFLFMGIKTNDENVENFSQLWKEAYTTEKIERQIKCTPMTETTTTQATSTTSQSSIIAPEKKMALEIIAENAELKNKIGELGQRQMLMIFMLLFLLLIHLLTVVQFRSAIDNLIDTIKEHSPSNSYSRSDL